MSVDFDVNIAELHAIGVRAENAFIDAVGDAADHAAALARGFAPKRTGALAGSIYVSRGREGAFVQARVRYGRYQELGTKYVEAKHFIARAAEIAGFTIVPRALARMP